MKMQFLGLGALALASVTVLGGPALAQAASKTVHADSGLPFCSAQVQDRCIQRTDLRREGKPVATKKVEG